MEKIIVRLSIFGIAIYFLIVLAFSWLGYNISSDVYIIFLDYSLYQLACNDKKYHCKFARSLPLNLMLTDFITITDNYLSFIPGEYGSLIIISIMWATAITITIILGIRHFNKVRKTIKKKKRYEEYKLKK